jgi:DNA primase
MDLIMSHQIGVENTIAVSGTALTEEHLAIIHRYADEIVVAFDSDTAGMKAAERAFILALSIGLNVKAILVKGGKDPADYILENKEEWRQVVEKGEHIINFMLQTIEARKAEGNEKRKLIESHVLPYVAALRSSIERAQFVHKIALELDVEDDAVWAEIRKIQAVSENGKSNSAQRIVVNPAKKEKDRILEILSRINGILVWQKSVPNSPIDVALIEDKVRKILPSAVFETNAKDAMAAELAYSNSSRLVNVELDEILMILEEEIISKQMSELLKNMKRSESKSGGSSPPDIPNLEKEYNELLMRKSILQSERRKT